MASRFKQNAFTHQQPNKVAVILTNLGTPKAPTPKALRHYLKEFLSDPRVVEIPRIIWLCILHLIILRVRPAKSAKAYQTVWTERGSPLMFHTQDQCENLKKALHNKYGEHIIVEFAMRYAEPAIHKTLDKVIDAGARKVFVLPLYPQYSGSTTGSTFDAIGADFKGRRWLPDLRFLSNYHNHPLYITAIAKSIQDHWDKHGQPEKLIFSYHGVPLKYLQDGDPYHCQCLATTRLIIEKLGLSEEQYMTTFQSRFGKATWLQPYTDKTLQALGAQGIKNIQVVCPGFSSDCLETIEEIGEENRDYFLQAGGERFDYIPALNATQAHIELLTKLTEENMHGWLAQEKNNDASQREERYLACPHNKK